MSSCRLPASGSAPGPRPGGAGGVPLVSRAEPSRSASWGRHPESQDLGARRAEALLAPAPRWAGQTGGTRANPAVYAPRGAGWQRRRTTASAPACPGWVVPDPRLKPRLSGRADQPRLWPPAAAFSAAVSRGRARGGGSRWHCQPLPNACRQASRKRACTELMRLSSKSSLHRDCSLRC